MEGYRLQEEVEVVRASRENGREGGKLWEAEPEAWVCLVLEAQVGYRLSPGAEGKGEESEAGGGNTEELSEGKETERGLWKL